MARCIRDLNPIFHPFGGQKTNQRIGTSCALKIGRAKSRFAFGGRIPLPGVIGTLYALEIEERREVYYSPNELNRNTICTARCLERTAELESATFGLGSRCSTN